MKEKLTYSHIKEKCLKKHWRTLPLYAQYFTYKVSLRIVWLIYRTPVTPNQVTWCAFAIAVLAGLFFMQGTYAAQLSAALLLEFYYVFDCVDGQLARLKGLSSREGAFLDYLFNYVVHPGIFFAMGVGCLYASSDFLYLFAGLIAGWAMILNYALSDAKHSVHLQALLKEKRAVGCGPQKIIDGQKNTASCPKKIFMWMHKLATYPSIMNIITACALLGFIFNTMKLSFFVLLFFSCNITVVFVVRLLKMIISKDVTKEFESLKEEISRKEG